MSFTGTNKINTIYIASTEVKNRNKKSLFIFYY